MIRVLNLAISISEQVWFLAAANSFQEAAPKFPFSSDCRPDPNIPVTHFPQSTYTQAVLF